jgi:hypothetical protein
MDFPVILRDLFGENVYLGPDLRIKLVIPTAPSPFVVKALPVSH